MYTQDNQPFRIDTVLGKDVLLLGAFRGSESISSPYSFEADLASEKKVAARDLLRTPAHLTISLPDGSHRSLHGRISRFCEVGRDGDLFLYRAEVVPWLWFLSLSRECRIYQHLNVPEIVEQVFTGLGYNDFRIACTRSYAPRDFCVQYRETHLNFVSRLLEEEGIFYFFEHSDDKHVLVLADDSGVAADCPGGGVACMAARAEDEDGAVTCLEVEHAVGLGGVTLKDYDYLQPQLTLESSVNGDGPELAYDYHPGRYTLPEEGERYARLQLEAEEALRQTVRGDSAWRGFVPGYRFELKRHHQVDANQKYLVLGVEHTATCSGYRSADSFSQEYRNSFFAMPYAVPYRPRRITPRPGIQGSQTALVVGPAGNEIHVDEHGRVKVQFYWDREGKRDENSSCWVRVATPWGGKGYGNVTVPRIGNEVVVIFLEGDPDHPLIVGSVFNAEQSPPYPLPGAGITMGMKSRSSPGGGGQNEITMSDTKGKEMVTIHAQYDMTTTVQNDRTDTVNNNRSTTIAVDDSESVGANQTIDVGANQSTTVGGNQTEDVGGNRTGSVGGNESVSVGGNQEGTIGGDRSTTVGGDDTTSVGSNLSMEAGSNILLDAGANLDAIAGGTVTVDGKEVSILGASKITLSCGGSSIEIGPSGINITSGAIVQVQGATIKLN
ncbi:MAG TPA: type VI secretion system tip protein TssI/VgrG [Longimicrobiaceae bacterium]